MIFIIFQAHSCSLLQLSQLPCSFVHTGPEGMDIVGERAASLCRGGGPCSLEGGWGSLTPSLVLTSWNLCWFAPRHLGVSSVTARFLYFSKANKSGLVLHLPGLAGNPFLVMWWWDVLSLSLQNRRKPWEFGNLVRFRGKCLSWFHFREILAHGLQAPFWREPVTSLHPSSCQGVWAEDPPGRQPQVPG